MPEAFKCRDCGFVAPKKWTFRCPGCGGFYDIRKVNMDIPGAEMSEPVEGEIISLEDAAKQVFEAERLETTMKGVDHVLCGGFAKGGVYLITGDPGVGKTTLILQVFRELTKLKYDALYITGEQTVKDLALTAKRIGKFPGRMAAVRMTNLEDIKDVLDERQPNIVAIDSAQTLEVENDMGDPLDVGSATSIKYAIRELMKYAKETETTIVIVGHVTKGGAIGGPRALEHYVDCNLHFAGQKDRKERTLKCDFKNRFGETPRYAHFKMGENGLEEIDEKAMKEADEEKSLKREL